MRELDRKAVERIAKGACFLGSGGGGPLSITPTIIENIFKHTDKIKVVEMKEVPGDAALAIAAGMGSPARSAGITFDTAPSVAFDEVAKLCGKQLEYVAAVEVGAANSVIPMLVAAQKGIPLVDANGAGRAVPTLPSTTYAQSGVPAAPAVLSAVGVEGNKTVSCKTGDAAQVEEWAGKVLTSNPNFTKYNAGAVALWAFDGKKLNSGKGADVTAIGGSLDLAEKIGHALEQTKPVEAVKEILDGSGDQYQYLGKGKVVAVKEKSVGALDGGIVEVEMGNYIIELPFLNEFLGAFKWDSSNPTYILGPDMICCMTPDGEPLSNPSIQSTFEEKGPFEMAVFSIQAAAPMRKKAMFDMFAENISKLYPAFKGGYRQPGVLTMSWAWD